MKPRPPTAAPSDPHEDELRAGERFAFGANWRRFLEDLTSARVADAEASLVDMLGLPGLSGKTFVDVGSGSGLFSLAARRLGATVRSFDYDPESVACTAELRRRAFPDDDQWVIERASILDDAFTATLGQYDVVYAWGSLHHTGDMWRAIARTVDLVAPGGRVFLAIYNDQGLRSSAWRMVKRLYCAHPAGRAIVTATAVPGLWLRERAARLLRPRRSPITTRGMSLYRDWIDWLGGYPFEVAKPAAVTQFLEDRGFAAVRIVTTPRMGCNQFVFLRPKS